MPIAKSRLEVMQVCKLLQCVREKNTYQIEKLVNSGIPHLINYTDPGEGDSALAIAAIANDEEMIQFLLALGAHPDVVDLQGRSAIMKAAEYGHVESFESLTKSGANLKTTDLKGRGVLFYCLSPTERHAKCIEIALAHNTDVNTKAKDGRTAFFAACETAKENEETCLALLDKGADPNVIQIATGRTALMMAAASGSAKVVRETLRRGADGNVVDKFGRTAAHEAARLGHFDVMVCLGGHGCNFDVYDNKGNNPIHLAANGHAMICKYLGQRGCNPKPKNNDGFLPKIIAKDNGHKECMKELRKVEKSFGKVGKNNEPWALALYDWSVIRQDELTELFKNVDPDDVGLIAKDDFVDILKGQGAPWTDEAAKKILVTFDKNKDGRVDFKDFLAAKKYVNKNYLMAAFEGKKKKKKKGGRGGGKKKKGKPPMEICVMPGEEIMRTLDGGPPIMYIPKHVNYTDNDRFNRDKPPIHPLQDDSVWYLNNPEKQYVNMNDAAKFGDLDSIKNALRRGYSIDTRDKYYKTPLMMACQRGNLEMAKALIEYGANVNAKDNFHWMPLHHACHAGMLDVVELLLNNGAIMDAPSMNGATPLNRAIEASKLNVVQYLIKKGAKMQSETRKGASPMDVAYTWADPRVIDAVKTKFDTLAPVGDKKGGKGGKKGGGRPKTAPGSGKSKSGDAQAKSGAGPSPPSPTDEQLHARRKASILRAASALAAGLEEREEITYCPRKPWLAMPTTEELLSARQVRRERFGWEVDFPDFEMPFNGNITKRCLEMEGEDD